MRSTGSSAGAARSTPRGSTTFTTTAHDLRKHAVPALRRRDRYQQSEPRCWRRSSPTRSTTSRRRATSRSRSRSPSTPRRSTRSARSGSWTRSGETGLKTRFYQASTSELYRQGPGGPADGEDARSTRVARTGSPSCTRTGSSSTTARPTACSPATGSCSTTSRRAEARPS